MSSYQDYANAVSNILEKQGEAQARAAEQTGQIWGGAVSNIGQYIAQIPEQRAKLQEIQNRAALTALETQREQRLAQTEQNAQIGQQAINDTVSKFPRNEDGTVNTAQLYQELSKNPKATPDQIDKVIGSIDRMNDFTTKYNQTQRDKTAEWANNVQADHDPKEPITWDAVHFAAALAPKGFISPDDQQMLATAEQQGADPGQVLNGLKRLGSQYKKEQEPYTLAEGAKRFQGSQVIAENPKIETPKNDAELLFDALNPNSKTQQISFNALQKKADDAAAALKNKPLTPYEQQETLDRARNFDLAQKRYALAVKNSDKAAGQQGTDLVNAVIAHPELFNQLTPTVRGQLAGQLDKLGFKDFGKGPSATMENRLQSSTAVVQTGNDIINSLRDPKIAAQLGPIMGRYNSVADFVGAPPPEFKKLAGQIESYSLANMGVHGMRSSNGAEAIRYTLGEGTHTPESIIAAIEGLNGFANHLLANQGRPVPSPNDSTPPPAKSGPPTVGSLVTFQGKQYRVKAIENGQAVLGAP